MDPIEVDITPEHRARLVVNGQFLTGKFCGTGGRGICAESFVLHHIQLGEPMVARDLVTYLDDRIKTLRINNPDGRLSMTKSLANRIRGHLMGEEP